MAQLHASGEPAAQRLQKRLPQEPAPCRLSQPAPSTPRCSLLLSRGPTVTVLHKGSSLHGAGLKAHGDHLWVLRSIHTRPMAPCGVRGNLGSIRGGKLRGARLHPLPALTRLGESGARVWGALLLAPSTLQQGPLLTSQAKHTGRLRTQPLQTPAWQGVCVALCWLQAELQE